MSRIVSHNEISFDHSGTRGCELLSSRRGKKFGNSSRCPTDHLSQVSFNFFWPNRFTYIFVYLLIFLVIRCTDAESMISCAKPKVLAYLSEAVNRDDLPITRDLSIVRSRSSDNEAVDDNFEDVYSSQDLADPERKQALRDLMLERLDAYLSSHRLVARLPEDIASSNIVPRSFMDSVPRQLSVPLTEEENGDFLCYL